MSPELRGPLYLDASALVKLYLTEPGSDEVNELVAGRQDLIVSDLAVTEVASAVARRMRDGALTAETAHRLRRAVLRDLEAGHFLRASLTPRAHREAERYLLQAMVALRALDALHLSLATLEQAATLVTFDARLRDAARAEGLAAAP